MGDNGLVGLAPMFHYAPSDLLALICALFVACFLGPHIGVIAFLVESHPRKGVKPGLV